MRLSAQRLQHPRFFDSLQDTPQKVAFQGLLTELEFEFRHPVLILPVWVPLPSPPGMRGRRCRATHAANGERCLAWTSHARTTSAVMAPASSRRTASLLNSLVNFLRDSLMALCSMF
jgi:hypothetical protein